MQAASHGDSHTSGFMRQQGPSPWVAVLHLFPSRSHSQGKSKESLQHGPCFTHTSGGLFPVCVSFNVPLPAVGRFSLNAHLFEAGVWSRSMSTCSGLSGSHGTPDKLLDLFPFHWTQKSLSRVYLAQRVLCMTGDGVHAFSKDTHLFHLNFFHALRFLRRVIFTAFGQLCDLGLVAYFVFFTLLLSS